VDAGRRRVKGKIQFSKILTGAFATVMLPFSAYVVVRCLDLAEMAIQMSFSGALPYVTAIVGFVEASVVIVLGCYYDNSKKEKVAKAQFGTKRDC
jgi:Na+/H+-translocating membrane pyrophosphatase